MLNFLIIGGGNLGFRYAEGIFKIREKFKLTIIDKSHRRLEFLKQKLTPEISNSNNKLELLTEIIIPRQFDLAIVSTNSDVRFKIFNEYNNTHSIRYWILEKVLSPSLKELSLFPKNNNIWVNTFLRSLKLFSQIKNKISTNNVLIEVTGGNWGLACNAIHYIDLASWIFNKMPHSINNDNLLENWFPSKREGFFEINGVLLVKFSGDNNLMIKSNDSKEELKIVLRDKTNTYTYNLISGDYQINMEKKDSIPIPFQSDMTADIINEILESGNSSLAPIDESIFMHELLIKAFKSNWEQNNLRDIPFKIT